jgi:cytochrome c553
MARVLIRALIAIAVVIGMAAAVHAERPSAGSARAAEQKAATLCSTCHGPRGVSTSPEFPNLAGQRESYFVRQIEAFRARSRAEKDAHDFMWGIASQLEDGIIAELAHYYAAQAPAPGRAADPSLASKGKELFDRGAPDREIPACASCHGPNAEGKEDAPRLAGQHAKYVAKQLRSMQDESRANEQMREIVKKLRPEEMVALSAYVQSR